MSIYLVLNSEKYKLIGANGGWGTVSLISSINIAHQSLLYDEFYYNMLSATSQCTSVTPR